MRSVRTLEDVRSAVRQRVTVKLLAPDPETSTLYEWAHANECQESDAGVRFDWGESESSFFPWHAILRVDRELCTCAECRGDVAKAAA